MNASDRIDSYIAKFPDWRGKRLARLRRSIAEAAPDLAEDWKWNVPVWVSGTGVVACAAFKDHVKVNFFEGASLPDPKRLLNAGLDAKKSRGIDVHEGDALDEASFKALVRAAAALRAKAKQTPRSGR